MPSITVALWIDGKWLKINKVLSYLPSVIKYGDKLFIWNGVRREDNYQLYREMTDVYEIEPQEIRERISV